MKSFWCSCLALSFVLGIASVASAQPGRGPGGFGFGDSTSFLLRDDAVRKELEIVPGQIEKLEAAEEKMREQMRDMFSGLRDLPEEDRRAKFEELRGKMADAQEQMRKEIDEILLPQQRDRLAQIRFQSQMRRGGSTGSLTGNAVVEALGISEDQLEEMRKKEEEVREELTKKIQEAQEEARNEILSVLTPAQRKKYEELMGQPFEFQERRGFGGGNFRQGGRQGGGGRQTERPST